MTRALLPAPGIVMGAYPEKPQPRDSRHLAWLARYCAYLPFQSARRWRRLEAAAQRVQGHIDALRDVAADPLQADWRQLRASTARDGLASAAAEKCLAQVVLAAQANTTLIVRPNQILAALAVLHGLLAEVPTGEGKSLAILLAACVAALAGVPVHLVTSNDYLAERDAQHAQRLAQQLGLSLAAISAGMSRQERRQVYAKDICYCSAKELVFDYLRDSLQSPHQRILRGLCMAIVDEADSVLIDEAATPFILSESHDQAAQLAQCSQALSWARSLRQGLDFHLDARQRRVSLSDQGRQQLASKPQTQDETDAIWLLSRYREEMVELALRALYLLKRDVDYLVHEGKIQLIDAGSGRRAEGRSWSRGLHQMVEIKEHCQATPATRVIAQITFQSFFSRYLHLAGMSATLHEARFELLETYAVLLQKIPSGRASRLQVLKPAVFAGAAQRWQAVLEEISAHHQQGRAVLVGTDSVQASEHLSQLLSQAGLRHQLLNARQDAAEAQAIALAGQAGAITVSTNMAGRGTDITVVDAVLQRGGLHVLSCQHNSAARIDRQLFGRAARAGHPGSARCLLSLEEGLLQRYLPAWLRTLLKQGSSRSGKMPSPLARLLVFLAQRHAENTSRAARRALREAEHQQRQVVFGLPHT